MSHPRVLVVQHQPSCPVALFGDWLAQAGVRLEIRRADRADGLAGPDLRAGSYDGLLVLGGAVSALDDEASPWLPAVRDLIAQAARLRVPTLGICLGHQLAAQALGGAVAANPFGPTIGLRQVDWEPEIIFDPLVRDIAGEDRAVHWNEDVVTELPPGGLRLASTLDGQVQAARHAPTVWGVQFHPEADAEVVRGWAASHRAALAGRAGEEGTGDGDTDEERVVAPVVEAAAELSATWRRLAEAFAALVRGRRAAAESTGVPGPGER
ncbi:MAG: type 1 glutamine amidotransferase [Nocardioides sp.]|uniref:type 1 glutamine amidotransferase n=1 Tax=Nocardioides sp. TaxID=35761 RepID=UPI0039E63E3C